ncbi:MAG TPA: hypothetical protein VMN37_05025 [Gemmatimonadales bacterium]|nr:hypothetical protein [Gemmatimonadales bacterium]
MTRAAALLLVLLATLAPVAHAQRAGPIVKYGKWVLAAGAVSMNLLAARAHDDAEDAFDRIEDACFEDRLRCIVNTEGRYADGDIEALYQTSLHQDRVARRWLILGETALVGAAAMFVWELTRKSHEPDNIPFEPEVRSLRHATGIGLRIPW